VAHRPMTPLRRVHKTVSITQKAYQSLERAIAERRLTPGQVLVTGDLAEKLGVSRTPVREALLMLEKAGLVESANGRMMVAGLSLGDLDEVFELREAIERFCLEKVATQGRPDRFRALHDLLVGHPSPDDVDGTAAAAADRRFHRTMVALAANERLLAAWDQMATHLKRFWHDGRSDLDRARSDIAECRAIVAALEAGDVDDALLLLREHLQRTKLSLAAWQRGQRPPVEPAGQDPS